MQKSDSKNWIPNISSLVLGFRKYGVKKQDTHSSSLPEETHPSEWATNDLLKIARMEMPFGKHKGWALVDLPERYVVWFYNQGLPNNEFGRLMGLLYEIKVNGLEYLFEPLRDQDDPSSH